MPIIENKFTQTDTNFFINHTPYSLDENEAAVDLLADMYSINILPSEERTIINDGFGLENVYEFTISIQNLTKNITLLADLEYGNYLTIDSETSNITILPEQLVNILVKTDRNKIDSQPVTFVFDTELLLTIRNQRAPSIAIQNLVIPLLTQTSLPKEVTIA
jgi:phage-related protein